MGLSTMFAVVLNEGEDAHDAMVTALRSEQAASWSSGAAVSTLGDVTTVLFLTYESPDGLLLSRAVAADAVVLLVNIHDSDVAVIDVFVADERVASACFGVAMVAEMNQMHADFTGEDPPPPPQPIEGHDWWIAHRPDTSRAQLDELMSEPYVLVEQPVVKLLAPLGVPPQVIDAFAPDVIANPGDATVTAV